MKNKWGHGSLRKWVALAVFSALALLCTMVLHIRVAFLTFDVKDSIITIASMFFGPLAGVTVAFLTALLEMLTVSTTGLYGFVMNFLASAAYAGVAGLIYCRAKTLRGAYLSLGSACLSMTVMMLGANLLITPFYFGCTVGEVVRMIPALFLPFNLIKGVLNAALVLLLYKPLTAAMRKTGFYPVQREAISEEPAMAAENGDGGTAQKKNHRRFWVALSGILLLLGALGAFFLMGGHVAWF